MHFSLFSAASGFDQILKGVGNISANPNLSTICMVHKIGVQLLQDEYLNFIMTGTKICVHLD